MAHGGGILRVARLVAILVAALPFVLANSTASAAGAGDPSDENWHTDFTLYGWLPGVTADLRFKAQNQPIESESDNNIFDHLNGAAMFAIDAHKGDWGIFGDFAWVKFSEQKGRFRSIDDEDVSGDANLNTRWGLKGGMISLAGTYSLSRDQNGFVDVLLGGRYLWIKGNLDWNFTLTDNETNIDLLDQGHVARSTNVFDAIIGVHGRWYPGAGRWYVPYYADIGDGGTDATGQVALGAGYRFDWGDLGVSWRYMRYQQSSDNAFLRSVDMNGPSFALTWHF